MLHGWPDPARASCRAPASSAPAPRGSRRPRRCSIAGSRSTALRSQTRSAATGCSAIATGCRPPTATCSSTSRASGWPTRTTRCPSPTGLSPPHPHQGVLQQLRRSLRPARAHHLRDGVEHATRREDGVWEMDRARRRRDASREYDALIVANGHHWDARWPEPAFPGADTSRGPSCTPTPTWTTRSSPARTWSSSAWATRRWTSRSSPPTSPPTPIWRRAKARGSSPSTCSAGRSTSSPTTRACRSRSASG